MDITITCCGKEMVLNQYDPDQDENYVVFDCSVCGASLHGVFKYGEKEDGD